MFSLLHVVSEVLNFTAQAPTFLDLAGFPIPNDMDGQSFKNILLGDVPEAKLVSELITIIIISHSGFVEVIIVAQFVPSCEVMHKWAEIL